MKLEKYHIAYRLLTDMGFIEKIVLYHFPNIDTNDKESKNFQMAAGLYEMLRPQGQRAFFITDTVVDKLDMLKVKKTFNAKIKKQHANEYIGEVLTYDWRVFNKLTDRKATFILPHDRVLRFFIKNGIAHFAIIGYIDHPLGKELKWTVFHLNLTTGSVCEFHPNENVQAVEEEIYKLLCFIYLSENEEVIVPPGGRHGTKKGGKVVNNMTLPITVVTSKWNVTSVRTEGFPVSGHLRLQPTREGHRMIFIEPFQKHGYVRRAKNDQIN